MARPVKTQAASASVAAVAAAAATAPKARAYPLTLVPIRKATTTLRAMTPVLMMPVTTPVKTPSPLPPTTLPRMQTTKTDARPERAP
jgi:hypothetical protein